MRAILSILMRQLLPLSSFIRSLLPHWGEKLTWAVQIPNSAMNAMIKIIRYIIWFEANRPMKLVTPMYTPTECNFWNSAKLYMPIGGRLGSCRSFSPHSNQSNCWNPLVNNNNISFHGDILCGMYCNCTQCNLFSITKRMESLFFDLNTFYAFLIWTFWFH